LDPKLDKYVQDEEGNEGLTIPPKVAPFLNCEYEEGGCQQASVKGCWLPDKWDEYARYRDAFTIEDYVVKTPMMHYDEDYFDTSSDDLEPKP